MAPIMSADKTSNTLPLPEIESLQDSKPRATESVREEFNNEQSHYATRETSSSLRDSSEIRSTNAPQPELVIDSTRVTYDSLNEDDEPPQSVIHAPSGFSEFVNSQQNTLVASASPPPSYEPLPESNIPLSDKPQANHEKKISNGQISPPPLTTTIEPIMDWAERATPRAQTMEDFGKTVTASHTDFAGLSERVHHSASLTHEEVSFTTNQASERYSDGEIEVKALKVALTECWSLCNTLASLSDIHRERSNWKTGAQENTWKSCWRLCQELYNSQDLDYDSQINPTLDLCRDFCQTLFDTRSRDNELADSILRVSFELSNHLYNTHDRTLPDAFRERTLDFYITLCHRLMKQRSQSSESNTLLSACWALAEMLFSIRQSKREKRQLDEELLGSAVQACWELCDIFREGWTRHRLVESIVTPRHIKSLRDSDSGTPRPSQATFKQTAHHSLQSSHDPNGVALGNKGNPETPTTIFEETATVSPDDAPIQSIFVLGQGPPQSSHRKWSSNSSSASGHTQSSEQTSSTNTVTTFKNDSNLVCIKILVMKAALDSGFQRGGPQSLSSFVKSLSSDAFGPMSWQISLLKNYKRLVVFDPGVRSIGIGTQASAVDIAKAVQAMVPSGSHLWLQDLYRLVFGFHIDEAEGREEIILHV
ncbi:hypothetical protein BDV59DRAFT_167597 [Aspergillus ambiguus]|uniref:uncharacterized protein n=1 Tax=Aspergillus ambiguus TaxID=176160 RepID=UPI003CCD4F9E